MSKCPGCLQGLCRRHPLQDHGQREAHLSAKAAEAGIGNSKSACDLIKMQIEKLQNAVKGTTEEDQDEYRLGLELDRRMAEKRKRKSMSSEHLDLAMKSSLHASVLSAMMAPDSEADTEGSSSSSSEQRKSKKSKKSSKSDKKKDKKKKEKKEKKEKNRKRKRSRNSSHRSAYSDSETGIDI